MLLAAIEDDLRTEMVNRRMCDSAVGSLYRLMTLYAPGGESEKTLTLNKLQNPTRCTAQTLGLLTPDPTILVKAVAGITAGVFDKGSGVFGPFVAPGGFQTHHGYCNAVPQQSSW